MAEMRVAGRTLLFEAFLGAATAWAESTNFGLTQGSTQTTLGGVLPLSYIGKICE